ncbi:MAG: hypothetical protein R2795_11085 [Saprospiraceae bacterium]
MLEFLAQGYSCPRKVLINSDAQIVNPADTTWLRNINTPEEMVAAKALLDKSKY